MNIMALIIDGYNLLNVTGIVGRGTVGSSLARSRTALLDFLAARLAPEERRRTTVVFDARHAPPGLQATREHRGITVRFAGPDREADDLIEELIHRDTSPRRLTIVSSDHRLHRAARRRRAAPVDSDVWFRQFARRPIQASGPVDLPGDLPSDAEMPVASPELDEWLRIFSENPAVPDRPPERPAESSAPHDLANPFPPGYAEDLLRSDDP